MENIIKAGIDKILSKHNYNESKLLQILLEVQDESETNHVSEEQALYISEALNVSLARTSGVISFFSVLSSEPRGKNIIRVCKSTACMVNGHEDLLVFLMNELGINIGETTKDGVFTLETTECIGACDISPAFKIGKKVFGNLTKSRIEEVLNTYRLKNETVKPKLLSRNFDVYNPDSLTEYKAIGGFKTLKTVLDMDAEKVIEEISLSGLRGRGGAGYPTGKKLSQAKSVKGDRKVLICNADEGEPGTFKDRQFIEHDPYQLIEGVIVTSFVTDVTEAYIYIRHEYNHLHRRLIRAIEKCEEEGILGKDIFGSGYDLTLNVISGAGAYICGQGGALIESMEGKVGYPRTKPPYTKQKGLHQLPTLVINVETLVTINTILDVGVDEYLKFGTEKSPGTKLISISGNINNPGAYEVPFGMTIKEIIDDLAGGIKGEGYEKFLQIGGASGPLMPAKDFNIKFCYDALNESAYDVGSGAIVVCDEDQKVSKYLRTVYNFFEHESCGKCTPCRESSHIIAKTLRSFCEGNISFEDLTKLEYTANQMADAALCGLGRTAPTALLSAFKHFEDELREEAGIRG